MHFLLPLLDVGEEESPHGGGTVINSNLALKFRPFAKTRRGFKLREKEFLWGRGAAFGLGLVSSRH